MLHSASVSKASDAVHKEQAAGLMKVLRVHLVMFKHFSLVRTW